MPALQQVTPRPHLALYVDIYRTSRRLSGEAEAARVGTVLAAAVLKAYHALQQVDTSTLKAVSRPVRLPVRYQPSASDVAAARDTVAKWGKGAPFNAVIEAWRTLDIAEYGRDGMWPSEVQAITFGRDLALVGYPGDSIESRARRDRVGGGKIGVSFDPFGSTRFRP